MQKRPFTLFSFGYEGWGNATPQLVKAVDTVERERGFDPPLFVDIRLRRSGRALGFQGDAFANLLGRDRYLWMDDLGNEKVRTRARGIRIRNDRAADLLLALALENARRPRRLIFFCWCGWPVVKVSKPNCHRVVVASLLRDAADQRKVDVEIVEWPGGSPGAHPIQIKLSPSDARKIRGRAKSIPLGKRLPRAELLGLPWASAVGIKSAGDTASYCVGPAQYWGGRWRLPKCQDKEDRDVTPADGPAAAADWRRDWGFAPLRTGAI